MNREFANTAKDDESLSTVYIKQYKQNNTLLQFMR
jgi:hypothetical protein